MRGIGCGGEEGSLPTSWHVPGQRGSTPPLAYMTAAEGLVAASRGGQQAHGTGEAHTHPHQPPSSIEAEQPGVGGLVGAGRMEGAPGVPRDPSGGPDSEGQGGARPDARSVRARVSPLTRPGASWGSINAAPIAPIPPLPYPTLSINPTLPIAPIPPNQHHEPDPRLNHGRRRHGVTRPAVHAPSSAAGQARAGTDAGEGSSGAARVRARAPPHSRQGAAGVGGRAGLGGHKVGHEGLGPVTQHSPAEVAGLLEAVRGCEALALAVRADTRASRQVCPGVMPSF